MVDIIVSAEDEFDKELGKFAGENGMRAAKGTIGCFYAIKCKMGHLWYVFAEINYSLPWGKMKVSIMKDAPKDEVCILEKFIERAEKKFKIYFSVYQSISEKMYTTSFDSVVCLAGIAGPAAIIFIAMIIWWLTK